MSEFVCPFCFAKTNTREIIFQCVNPNCTWKDQVRTAFLHDLPLSLVDENRAENHPTVWKARAPGFFSRFFGAANPDSGECPDCHLRSTIRVCPECHSPFPHGVDDLSNMVIAIVGAKETGKSHYIAVLIQRIRQLYKSFNWTLSAMDDETINLYKSHFYNPLYISQPARTLDVTQSARANAVVKKPLLYSLSMTSRNRYHSVTLAFFDTAGEDMDDERQMRIINRYIYNASGIIILLDPLQLPNVRSKFESGNLPQAGNTYGGDIINRISNLIRTGSGVSRNSKISIPLAVTFSKIDMMRDILGGDSPVFQQSRHRNCLNLREFEGLSGHIRDWIDQLDTQQTLVQQTLDYTDVGFFGVSSLGGNPSSDGLLPFAPCPMRVEDPFLWILWKKGFIQGDRS